MKPLTNITFSTGNESKYYKIGRDLIKTGKVGCLIVAGGQGTRLKFKGPKGMFLIKSKSLFEIFANQIKRTCNQLQCLLQVAIMTSSENHVETMDFFKSNNFFSLESCQVSFFTQSELPFLDKDGHSIMDSKGNEIMAPDGNGSALTSFYNSGIWENWHSQGIQFVNFVLIDNILANPFDSELVGFHSLQNSDIVIKCIKRVDPQEKVGILVMQDDKVSIFEYSEVSTEDKCSRNENGNLLYEFANISLFSFSMDFIINVKDFQMPLHKAYKEITNQNGEFGWKCEKFIFDVLSQTQKVNILAFPREECFAPLKSKEDVPNVKEVLKNFI